MKNTITAQNGGYRVAYITGTDKSMANVYDGDAKLLSNAYVVSNKYFDEMKSDCETFVDAEVFTTQKGNQFKYGYDYEADEDYITKIIKGLYIYIIPFFVKKKG